MPIVTGIFGLAECAKPQMKIYFIPKGGLSGPYGVSCPLSKSRPNLAFKDINLSRRACEARNNNVPSSRAPNLKISFVLFA